MSNMPILTFAELDTGLFVCKVNCDGLTVITTYLETTWNNKRRQECSLRSGLFNGSLSCPEYSIVSYFNYRNYKDL